MPAAPARERGCLRLLMAPFLVIAFGIGATGINALFARDYNLATLRLGLAAVFAVAAGVVVLVWRWAGSRQAEAALVTEPWRLRADWSQRRIRSGSGPEAILLCGVALIWNGVAAAAGYAQYRTSGLSGGSLLFLLFPLIGMVLLALAVVAVLRWRRYGTSTFELATLPASPGRALAGRVHLTTAIDPPEGFAITLRCLQITVTGSGKNTSTRESVLWERARTIPGALQETGGISVPIAFGIPVDARETDERDRRNRVIWRMQVSAAVPGVDYKASFEVPVFRTAESDTPLTPEESAALGLDTVDPG